MGPMGRLLQRESIQMPGHRPVATADCHARRLTGCPIIQ
jgi:hypothetical protein